MKAEWSSSQYLLFENQRNQPAIDLIKRIPGAAPKTVADLGCGPGNSTDLLRQAFPQAKLVGIDNSADMIRRAREKYPALEFISQDLRELSGQYDLLFSNACLQWVPDHPNLLPKLMSLLTPGGVLAVQVPVNFKEPIHQIIQKTVELPEWRERVPYHRSFFTLSPEKYFDLLAGISEDFTMWETVYMHRMPSYQAIMDWYSSTGLRPYLDAAVDEDAREGFYQEVFRQVKEAYPVQANGEVIFRFPRLFFMAKAK